MSSTSRPQTTGTANIQSGQSPSKPSQVESTNPPQNVTQPMYQNNPNQQFIPSNIPLINAAQQLQFQSQLSQLSNLHQTAALLQRHQSQLLQHHQQQQQPNSVESQLKTQQIQNGPLATFHNFPELLNYFLLSNPNLSNLPLPQMNQTQVMPSVQQQPLQTPKTMPVSPSKLGQSQHTPRSAVTGPQSVSGNINNAQTAEVNSATSVTPSATVSEHYNDTTKQPLTTSPAKSVSTSTVSTPSSTMSDRFLDEVKERSNVLQAISKNMRDENALSNNAPTPSESVQDVSPEASKSTLPRRKQTNVTGSSPIKVNPIISPPNPTASNDSTTFSTPKKSSDVIASPSEIAPAINISTISVPTTPTTLPDKKVKQTNKDVTVPKSVKKEESEPKKSPTTSEVQKPLTSPAQGSSSAQEPAPLEIKSKRHRVQTTLYQSPTPELALATRMSVSEAHKSSTSSKDKIFYTDEFLAVRNDEGSFYLCQCQHNIYRTSKKCRVRWLNKDHNSNDIYKLGYYDQIDKECILTSVVLENTANNSYKLMQSDRDRIDNILKKSIDVENGILPRPEVTVENPDGLDISLYKDESQLELKSTPNTSLKRQSESPSKSTTPSKKVKKNTKTVKPPPNRRKRHSSNNESLQNKEKTSNQSKKKNFVSRSRRSNELSKVQSPSSGPKSTSSESRNTSTSSQSDESTSSDSGKNIAARTKTQKKSSKTSSSPSSEQQRTLRTRCNK